MKTKSLYLLLFILLSQSGYSQVLYIFDLDTTDYPRIRTKFLALDADGNLLRNLSASDFEITEDGTPRSGIVISCPPEIPQQPISSVLTIDVSGSMKNNGLAYAQSAASVWIKGQDFTQSECAITTFNNKNYLQLDFSTDEANLLETIDRLKASGGTSFNAGLIDSMAGALLIVERGKNKKVVVFLTDGFSTGNEVAIIDKAQQINATIYCITLNMPCPIILKNIAVQTGGLWFENITSEHEAMLVYQQILRIVQNTEPCTLEWTSAGRCKESWEDVDFAIKLKPIDVTAKTSYQAPALSHAKLECNPSSVTFKNTIAGLSKDTTIVVTAINAKFKVTNITVSDPAYSISPSSFTLSEGKSISLTLSFLPPDSGYTYCKFELINDLCNSYFFASGGWNGKRPKVRTLKLLQPNGGEVFVAGSDTVITWEGVLPKDKVRIEYRTDDDQPWIRLSDTATGLSYNLIVPSTVSDKYLARVSTNALKDDEMVQIPAGNFIMGSMFEFVDYPLHKVTISKPFYISKYEITQHSYEVVMETNPSNWIGDNLPVERVSWYDAIEYCNKRSDMEGYARCYSGTIPNIICDWEADGYRLPTESEWEYACRAGTGTHFYSGDMIYSICSPLDPNLDKIGWYCGNSYSATNIVGEKEPNAFGLYDMSGNVWEWCWDWFAKYLPDDVIDPKGPDTGTYRTFRGGSWEQTANKCRSAHRHELATAKARYTDVGFRVVRKYK